MITPTTPPGPRYSSVMAHADQTFPAAYRLADGPRKTRAGKADLACWP
jgi:hypothetical protein